jgi:hypothetical protein
MPSFPALAAFKRGVFAPSHPSITFADPSRNQDLCASLVATQRCADEVRERARGSSPMNLKSSRRARRAMQELCSACGVLRHQGLP